MDDKRVFMEPSIGKKTKQECKFFALKSCIIGTSDKFLASLKHKQMLFW